MASYPDRPSSHSGIRTSSRCRYRGLTGIYLGGRLQKLLFLYLVTTSSAEDHRNWGVADSVLSWVIKVPTLAYLFYTAVDDLENGVVDAAVDAPAPPPTADRMN